MRSTLLGVLLGPSLFKLLLKLVHFLSQISHLAGISAALLPGLLCGIKELTMPVLLLAVFNKLGTIDGVKCGEGPTFSLSPFAILGSQPFLGAPLSEPPPFARFLGTHTSPG